MANTAFRYVWIAASLLLAKATYHWPSPQFDALESMLYDGVAPDFHTIANIAKDCGTRPTSSSPVSAEWVRLAYHDMATHDVDTGTGGIDASIKFELDRPENIGAGQSNTLFADFAQGYSKYVPYSDIIAMGVVWGVAACQGPIIPFKGGRIDATAAGPAGVPTPDEDLATHTESFRKQGFTATEMIGLVACGHTLGAVRNPDFPNLVAPPSDPSAPDNFAFFDGTAKFDPAVVSQYLDGTTQNVLVTTSDTTFASDLRIFGSDGNATMNSLNTDVSFASTCTSLLTRLINTVPSTASLTDVITLQPVKIQWANIIWEEQLLFNVAVRFVVPINAQGDAPTKEVKLYWCDRYGTFANCAGNKANLATGPILGGHNGALGSPITDAMKINLQSYEFTAPLVASEGVGKFWIVADGVTYDNGGTGYVYGQDQVVFLPWLKEFSVDSGGLNFLLVVGVRSDSSPSSVTISATGTISSTLTPVQSSLSLSADPTRSAANNVDGYTLYSATLNHIPDQTMIDSTAVIDGVTYTDDYRPLLRDNDRGTGGARPVSPISKVSI